jgi:PKD domain/HYR domain
MKFQKPLVLRFSARLCLGLLMLLGLYLGVQVRAAHAQSTLTVNDCSSDSQLQTDISLANTDNNGDTINFSCGGSATIPLSSTLIITGSMTIDGGGQITLSGQNSVVVLLINSGTVYLKGLTIANGSDTAVDNGCGGGLSNSGGTVYISNSTFTNNSDNNYYNNWSGGGICNDSGSMSIDSSTFTGNSTPISGGAIYNHATLTVSNSTFNNNAAYDGGGIANFNGGTVTITNSTISNNTNTVFGGALENVSATMTITNSTLSGNHSNYGGAIFDDYGTINISGSIVAGNTAYQDNGCDVAGIPITDNGYNLESGTDCGFTSTGSLQNTNPLLSALANNGGPTQTMALQLGSPAIDRIPLASCPSTDQRGHPRPDVDAGSPAETACDMGAFESNLQDNDLNLTNMPANISTNATSVNGAVVTYTAPTATDEPNDSSTPTVSCNPASGSTFAIGKTTVTCTATDSDDINSPFSKTFTVTVKPTLTLSVPKTMKATEGAVFNIVQATGTAYGTINPLTATITWGDGSSPQVILVTPAADGSYSVSASHTYAEEGSYSLTIAMADHNGRAVTRTATVKVADAALKITQSSRSISGLTVTQTSVFSDADPNGTLSDYTASINWGDGNTTSATLSSGFTAQGSHSYANHGTYTVKLTVTDVGGSTVSKSITITV